MFDTIHSLKEHQEIETKQKELINKGIHDWMAEYVCNK
jgi:hypothetical protein